MGIFSKSPEAAQAAITKAEAVVADWERKAAEARAEAARLDAESGAAILEDESAAENITLKIQAQERKARAYDQAATEARRKLRAAQRDALEAEAREEDKQAAAASKVLQAHNDKVDGLLMALKDLEGCDYVPGRSSNHNDLGMNQAQRSTGLWQTLRQHEVRAALIRYFIATGKVTHDIYDINEALGTNIQSFLRSIPSEGIEIPASILAARDAGLSFAE